MTKRIVCDKCGFVLAEIHQILMPDHTELVKFHSICYPPKENENVE